jgi:quinol monooxygenase YgiN
MEAGVIAVVAKLTVKDGKGDEFAAAAREMVAVVGTAEAGRTLMYSLHRSKDDPNVFMFYEQYADDDAIAAHGKSEHMAAFGGKIRDLLAGRAEIARYELVAGLQ